MKRYCLLSKGRGIMEEDTWGRLVNPTMSFAAHFAIQYGKNGFEMHAIIDLDLCGVYLTRTIDSILLWQYIITDFSQLYIIRSHSLTTSGAFGQWLSSLNSPYPGVPFSPYGMAFKSLWWHRISHTSGILRSETHLLFLWMQGIQ